MEFYFESNKCHSFIVTNIVLKNIYLGFFKFYQPKATGGGFLIFEWTLWRTKNFFHNCYPTHVCSKASFRNE
jgi:hypothetical protein